MGGSCSGKTFLAGRLAEQLGVPHIELDALHHGPNWNEASAEELQQKVRAALEGLNGWIVDGNYQRKIGNLVVDQADTIVFLDMPLSTQVRRLWRRTTRRIRERTMLWNEGNYESWRGFLLPPNSLFWYEVRAHRRRRRNADSLEAQRDVVRLRSPAEVAEWLSAQL